MSFFDSDDGVVGGAQRMHRHDGRLLRGDRQRRLRAPPRDRVNTGEIRPGVGDARPGVVVCLHARRPSGPGTLLLGCTGLYRIEGEIILPVKASPDGSLRAAVLLHSASIRRACGWGCSTG